MRRHEIAQPNSELGDAATSLSSELKWANGQVVADLFRNITQFLHTLGDAIIAQSKPSPSTAVTFVEYRHLIRDIIADLFGSAMITNLLTVHDVQRAACSVQCGVWSVECGVCSAQCAVRSGEVGQCAVCSVQCAVCSVQWAPCSGHRAVGSAQCAECSVHDCAVCSGQCAVGSGEWGVGSGEWAVGTVQWAVGTVQ